MAEPTTEQVLAIHDKIEVGKLLTVEVWESTLMICIRRDGDVTRFRFNTPEVAELADTLRRITGCR